MLHESCYQILLEVYDGGPISLQRLLEVCRSIPIVNCDRSCEHDYKDLYVYENRHGSLRPDCCCGDPYKISELSQVMVTLQNRRSISFAVVSYRGTKRNNTRRKEETARLIENDGFLKLPLELLDIIASYMLTADYFSMRFVSRALATVLFSTKFWASRFAFHGEHAYIFKARQSCMKGFTKWHSLYCYVISEDIPYSLGNRMRIWHTSQLFRDRMDLQWTNCAALRNDEPDGDIYVWREVQGDITEDKPAINWKGCHLTCKSWFSITNTIIRMAVSVIKEGRSSYITGIKFVFEDETAVSIGYSAQPSESEVHISRDITPLGSLSGFILCVGPRGIHAVQTVCGDSSSSDWLGYPDQGYITRHLVFAPVAAAAAGFDVIHCCLICFWPYYAQTHLF